MAVVCLIGCGVYFTNFNQEEDNTDRFAWEEEGEESEIPKEVRIREALAWNFEITKDEALGYPPVERLASAIEQTRRLQEEYYANTTDRDGVEDARWKERGPSNIGGRTRAILIDKSDPERKKVWSGSVSGGLWYTEDITADNIQWNKVNDYLANLSIGALAQNPLNPSEMYAGTGESYTGTVSGLGVFKSTDNGVNWELIPSTSLSNTSNFQYTNALLVHPETGDVYVGTTRGLHRSTNGGDTWQKVLGNGAGSPDVFYDIVYEAGNIFASTRSTIYKSATGDLNDWSPLGGGFNNFPTSWQRCEFTICHTNPNIMYALGNSPNSNGAAASFTYASFDGGATWQQRARPENQNGSEFTNGQAWYDLDIAVNPYDCNNVVVGGVPAMHSFNGGITYNFTGGNMHVDHHLILFDYEIPGRIIHGNDGGIYHRDNGSGGLVDDKNSSYNVTQFYAGALHPEAYSNYMLGGTQDNNSLQMDSPGIGTARNVNGGDGMFCHIDQDDGQIQIVSSQFGNYVISTDGGLSQTDGVSVNGRFVNISDYDNDANILYAQSNNPGGEDLLYRYHIGSQGPNGPVSIGVNFISALHCDPNVDNRLYIGSSGGRVYRLDNAHQGEDLQAVQLAQVGGTILSIDVAAGDPDHLLITKGNYGVANNVYESTDGGETWVGVEGTAVSNNLPDVPVRWGIFNPADANQAMIATEVGVWATDNLDGENTVWYPPVPNRGTPLVRTDMLQVRTSDRVVLAATHGRGMFTSDVWADPKAILAVPRVGYEGGRIFFNGSASINASSYDWDLGDGTSSEDEDFFHTYEDIGFYDVALTIEGDNGSDPELNDEGTIKILPNRPVPYTAEEAEYGGSFESNDEQWGIDNVGGGSTWERGVSSQAWKDGTNSGSNAFVIAKDDQFYEENSESYLYLPNFDFSERTIYEFSFFAKFNTAGASDGFNVEYSTNKGENWRVLGSTGDTWYNFANDNFGTATPFAFGDPFFTGEVPGFRQYKLNVTEFLSGQEDVAFRFVFRSGAAPGNFAGAVIDDVQIKKFNGNPVTTITQQSLEFDETPSPDDLVIKWTTLPEFYAEKFDVLVSTDGLNFERQTTVDARSIIASTPTNYTARVEARQQLYFVQILAYSRNEDIGLNDTLRAPIMSINKNTVDGTEIFSANPNPFVTSTTLTFTGFIDSEVKFELFDVAGRLISEDTRMINGFSTRYDSPNLATGRYILRYTIGDEDPKLFDIVKFEN